MNGPEDLQRVPLAVSFNGRDGNIEKDAYIKNGYIEQDGDITRVRPRWGVVVAASWTRPDAALVINDDHACKINVCPRSAVYTHAHCFTSYVDSAGQYYLRLHTIRDGTWVIGSGDVSGAMTSQLSPVCESAASNANVVMFGYNSGTTSNYYHAYDVATFPPTLISGGAVSGPTEQFVDAEMMNGYLFGLTASGYIYNSNINSNTSWSSLNYITTSAYFGKAMRLIKNGQFLLCFGTKHIEVFYDAGNPTNSPLNRYDDVTIPLNIYFPNAVLQTAGGIYVVGRMDGIRDGVFFIPHGSLEVTKVSTPAVDKYLFDRGTLVCVLQLFYSDNAVVIAIGDNPGNPSLNPVEGSLVYDPANEAWYLWDVTSYGNSGMIQHTAHNIAYPVRGTVLFPQTSNNPSNVRRIQPPSGGTEAVEIDGTPVVFEVATHNHDFDMRFVKSNPRVELIADQHASVTFNVFTSDDDYQTWDDCGEVSLADPRPEVHRLGMTRRRAYKIVRNEAFDVRVEALELTIEAGSG